jgi:hypothetical protein
MATRHAISHAFTPPLGWMVHSVCLSHHDTGGGTSGRWTFCVWYPPGRPGCTPLTWELRGGTPLLCCVNDRELATPYAGMRPTALTGEAVVRVDGLVVDSGLFPASETGAWVLVASSRSPSGYGSRRLLGQELGNLWEVPILLLDSLRDPDVAPLMAGICVSPPSCLLHTCTDVLLTGGFRGGLGGLQVRQELLGGLQVGLQASHASSQASSQALPGLRLLENSDLGLVLELNGLVETQSCLPMQRQQRCSSALPPTRWSPRAIHRRQIMPLSPTVYGCALSSSDMVMGWPWPTTPLPSASSS